MQALVPTTTLCDTTLLVVKDLRLSFVLPRGGLLPVVDTAELQVGSNEAIGIVGESGSGKTMLCRALIGTLARHAAVVVAGSIRYRGQELALAGESVWRRVRGREIGYVPQSSLAGLNPVLTIGTQMTEAVQAVKRLSHAEAEREAIRFLDLVRIPRVKRILREQPHQLSGGMRQRVMIAAALVQQPKLLIADEPTTALDVTTQREILSLLVQLRAQFGMALILVSHDLAVVEEVCDSIMVMYAGAAVEAGPIAALTTAPRHPYTRALRDSRVDTAEPGKDLETIAGEAVTVGRWPTGCRFSPRCWLAAESCRQGEQPALAPVAGHLSACPRAELMEAGRG